MADLPDWMRPPRPEGWFAEDLDDLPDAPRHTELIDGALVFMMSPQRRWHRRIIHNLSTQLAAQAPTGFVVESEMTVRLDERNRPEPDVIVATVDPPLDATWFDATDVVLAVEAVSPESEHRDRSVKPRKYADAGIRCFWRVEDEGGSVAIHHYELDMTTKAYVATGVARDTLAVTQPFPITLDVQGLLV